MILSKYCMERITEFDDEIADDAAKNASVMMKYIFFIKDVKDHHNFNLLLWCTRIFFFIGLSSYLTLVALIIFD